MGDYRGGSTQGTQFLNPYNFIKLPMKKAKAYPQGGEKHTGVIEYSITTRSPLFIPNTSSDKAFASDVADHGSFDFFSYETLERGRNYESEYFEPVIPGSELRGVIRSVYETLTDSCMGVLNADTHPVMRIGEMYQAALIKREAGGKFSLVKAEDCIYRKEKVAREDAKLAQMFHEEKRAEGTKVFFSKMDRGNRAKPLILSISDKMDATHRTAGYLMKGMGDGSIGKKHNCHVFIPTMKVLRNLSENDINCLKEVILAYQDEPNAAEAYKEYQTRLEAFLSNGQGEYFPVYYSIIEDKKQTNCYLAPACFSKERAVHSLGELAGEMVPCKSLDERCPTCDLFGMTGSDNEQTKGSRIRLADARVAEKIEFSAYYDKIITLENLGSPKLGNVEFYLEKPNGAAFWTYDYYTDGMTVHLKPGILRGRKFYWHQRDKKLPDNVEATSLNKTVRPVKTGTQFTGKLYFEGISTKQLSQLLWILNGGNDRDHMPGLGPIAYKIGMGKPLGLGSVELKVIRLVEREISLQGDCISYELKETLPDIPMYDEAGFSRAVKEDFLTIASLDAAKGKLVTYPVTEDQVGELMTEGFKWFVENHVGYDNQKKRTVRMPQKRMQMKRAQVLPQIRGAKELTAYSERKKLPDGAGYGYADKRGQGDCGKGSAGSQHNGSGRPYNGQHQNSWKSGKPRNN